MTRQYTIIELTKVLNKGPTTLNTAEYRCAGSLAVLLMKLDFKCIIKPSPWRWRDSSYVI